MNEYRFKVASWNGRGFRWITVTCWTAGDAERLAEDNLADDEALVEMSKIYPGQEDRATQAMIPHSNDTLLEAGKKGQV